MFFSRDFLRAQKLAEAQDQQIEEHGVTAIGAEKGDRWKDWAGEYETAR
jgi:hypothetical protein